MVSVVGASAGRPCSAPRNADAPLSRISRDKARKIQGRGGSRTAPYETIRFIYSIPPVSARIPFRISAKMPSLLRVIDSPRCI